MTYLTTYSSYRHVAGFDIVSSCSWRFIFDLFARIFRSGASRWTSWTSFFVVIVQQELIRARASLRARRYSSRKIYWSIRLLAIFASDVIFYFSRDTNKELAPLERIYIHWIYLFLFNSLRTSVFNHDQRIFRSYLYSTNFYEVFMALKKGTRKNHLTSQEQVPSDRCRRFVISQMTNDRSLPFEPHKFWIILLMHSCYADCIFRSIMKRL